MPAAAPPAGPVLTGLPPVARADARLLVLGSFPGVASLREHRYYAHPRNHFWRIVAECLGWASLSALSYPQRIEAAQAAGLAIWDVFASCQREGSLDSAIRSAQPNDLAGLVRGLPGLRGIAHNGAASARVRAVTQALGVPVWALPSTSPANARWRLADKCQAWREAFVACGMGAAGPVRPSAENPAGEKAPIAPSHPV